MLARQEAALKIEIARLDDELMRHPEMHYQTETQHALAVSYRDKARKDLAEAQATAELSIRRSAGADRLTEANIRALVAVDPKVKSVGSELLDWSFLEAQWRALSRSVADRRRVIGDLAKLIVSQYTDPSIRKAREQASADRVRKSGDA